jgi:organic hydroperoxide reductase OsmC/OhrA
VKISARVNDSTDAHVVTVSTADSRKALNIPRKTSGAGSAINGGELLMLALATCYCNDLYREAARLGVIISAVEVEASADFEGIGLAARNIRYRARIDSNASADAVATLLHETDAVAEVHNTLRAGADVRMTQWEEHARANAV